MKNNKHKNPNRKALLITIDIAISDYLDDKCINKTQLIDKLLREYMAIEVKKDEYDNIQNNKSH